MAAPHSDVLWTASPAVARECNLGRFQQWLGQTRGLAFDSYEALWRWSCQELEAFWEAVWQYYGLDQVSGHDAVLPQRAMPGAVWFPGARVNFAERCLTHAETDRPALVSVAEDGEPEEISWPRLRRDVAALAASLRRLGVRPGDRVAAYLPNLPHAVVALLASAAVGAVWTACSPDFGTPSVLARLQQAEPTVLFAVDGYRHGGKEYDRHAAIADLADGLPSLRHLVAVENLRPRGEQRWTERADVTEHTWGALIEADAPMEYADVPFDHPLWILWSSGTTGLPKGIVQGHGGITLELLKAIGLGGDLRADDRYFFVTSTSWMVWNFLVGGLLHGATLVVYDGSPTYPDVNGVWRVAERTRATIVGCGAAYLGVGEKADARPATDLDLSAIRSIQQTGSAMAPSTWEWVYREVSPDGWLNSISGGTDICSVLTGGTLLLPVREGRLQAPWLGAAVAAWDAHGAPVIGEQGELVVTEPMPSMPLRFLNDPDGHRYHDAYFDTFPGVWRHGDWIVMDPDLSIVITGRSDSTLNRMGIRMGSADIYAVVEQFPEVVDSLVIGVERADGSYFMPLFVVVGPGLEFTPELRAQIAGAIRAQLSPRHVPDEIVAVPAIPRTLTGKKLEVPVKRLLQGASVRDVSAQGAVTNPEMLDWFASYAASVRR